MKKKIAEILAKFARKTAVSACGATSNWNTYQPKEPSALRKFSK